MLDLAFIRNHTDIVKEAARVKYNPIDIDYLLEVDRQVLELQRQVEEARAEQNKISKCIREAGKDKAQRDALIAEGKLLAEQIKAMEPLLHELEETRQQLLYLVPNIPDPSAPIGKDENDNVPIRYWGKKPTFDFQPLDHYALMQKLDVVDIERAVKIAGARSYALKGDAARLELAFMNFAMDRIARKGFTPLTVPLTVRDSSLSASTQAVLAAEVGQLDLAYDYLGEAALVDLHDLHHNVQDGVHMASLAGSWTALVAVFGGMRVYKGSLSFAPRLPGALGRLAFHLLFRGCRLRVEVTATDATYRLLAGSPLVVRHHGEEIDLSVDEAVTRPIPPIQAGPQPAQPPGCTPVARRARRSS